MLSHRFIYLVLSISPSSPIVIRWDHNCKNKVYFQKYRQSSQAISKARQQTINYMEKSQRIIRSELQKWISDVDAVDTVINFTELPNCIVCDKQEVKTKSVRNCVMCDRSYCAPCSKTEVRALPIMDSCRICNEFVCSYCSRGCRVCDSIQCFHCNPSYKDRKRRGCKHCNALHCKMCLQKCHGCNKRHCASCLEICRRCKSHCCEWCFAEADGWNSGWQHGVCPKCCGDSDSFDVS